MRKQYPILLGGLGLFALQGCKSPQAELFPKCSKQRIFHMKK